MNASRSQKYDGVSLEAVLEGVYLGTILLEAVMAALDHNPGVTMMNDTFCPNPWYFVPTVTRATRRDSRDLYYAVYSLVRGMVDDS